MVRAKFKYNGFDASLSTREKRDAEGNVVKDSATGRAMYEEVEMRTLKFSPVYGNGDPNHENTKFWAATPSGEVKLGTVKPEAWSQFVLGQEYYLDFSAAAVPAV